MDPNEALKRARDASARVLAAVNSGDAHAFGEAACELANATQALDAWLCSGGALPGSWARFSAEDE